MPTFKMSNFHDIMNYIMKILKYSNSIYIVQNDSEAIERHFIDPGTIPTLTFCLDKNLPFELK